MPDAPLPLSAASSVSRVLRGCVCGRGCTRVWRTMPGTNTNRPPRPPPGDAVAALAAAPQHARCQPLRPANALTNVSQPVRQLPPTTTPPRCGMAGLGQGGRGRRAPMPGAYAARRAALHASRRAGIDHGLATASRLSSACVGTRRRAPASRAWKLFLLAPRMLLARTHLHGARRRDELMARATGRMGAVAGRSTAIHSSASAACRRCCRGRGRTKTRTSLRQSEARRAFQGPPYPDRC